MINNLEGLHNQLRESSTALDKIRDAFHENNDIFQLIKNKGEKSFYWCLMNKLNKHIMAIDDTADFIKDYQDGSVDIKI